MDAFIGQISMYGFPFAPKYWAYCDGSTLPLNQFSTLFALIGTTFGGNGSTNFGIPNLAGASPCGTGSGPGLTPRYMGQAFGTSTVTLDQTTMPGHTHTPNAVSVGRGAQLTSIPTAASALTAANGAQLYSDGAPNAAMSPSAISSTGGGGPHNNLQPYVAVNYCIALLGQFPEFG